MTLEDDEWRFPTRSCANVRIPHAAHVWLSPQAGSVYCLGCNELPHYAEARYCTTGCNCDHCTDIRAGLWPRIIKCATKWNALTTETRIAIGESVGV